MPVTVSILHPQAKAQAPEPARHEPPRLIDDPKAVELFTSACCGFSIGQGVVTLTFESGRCDHSDSNTPMTRVVVGRVVMPIPAAQALVLSLNDALQRSGHSPSDAATLGMVAQ